MGGYRVGYWLYAAGRRVLRTTGLVKLVRPFVGRAMAQWVYRLSGNADRPLLIQGHRMQLAPPGDYASPDMVGDRYEPATTRLFERLLTPGQTVLDVGAHVGYFTLLAARLVGPSGKVYAFEAAPRNYELLAKNIALNGYRQVTAIAGAVTEQAGPYRLYLSRLDNGFHSLFELKLPEPETQEVIEVRGFTLDAFLAEQGWPRVDFLKMDIEGGELAALRGMQEFLRRSPDVKLLIEFCPWILQTLGTKPEAFLEALQGLGFRLSVVHPGGPVPLEEVEMPKLIQRLQQRDGYTNLLGLRGAQVSREGQAATPVTSGA